MNLQRLVFPMRFYLLDENQYLKEQLAQKQRRIDELQDALVDLAKGSLQTPRIIHERIPAKPVQPKGWDDYRAAQRAKERTNEQPQAPEEQASRTDPAGNPVFQQRDAVGEDVPTGAGESRSEDTRGEAIKEAEGRGFRMELRETLKAMEESGLGIQSK